MAFRLFSCKSCSSDDQMDFVMSFRTMTDDSMSKTFLGAPMEGRQRSSSRFQLLQLTILLSLIMRVRSANCDYDCLYPRRPQTEELFNQVGHHERSVDLPEMMRKLQVLYSFEIKFRIG